MNLSFGARLRLQRERQQVALAAIAADTKIKASLLEALERDDFSQWPEGIFRRAYMRSYAQAIGLDPVVVLREFSKHHPDPAEAAAASSALPADNSNASASLQPATRLRRLVTAAIAAVPSLQRLPRREAVNATVPTPAREYSVQLVRYAASNENFVPVVGPHNGLGARSAPKDTGLTSRGLCRDIKGRALGWLEPVRPAPAATTAVFDDLARPEAARPEPAGVEAPLTCPAKDAPLTYPAKDERVRPEPSLSAIAYLCTRLGRVLDGREMTPLLEEAATLLDAVGLVVWSWDPRASALRPWLAHGYSSPVFESLPMVGRDADNAIAAAFRSNETCVVTGGNGVAGALVVPLMAPGGCVGVLALELRYGGEQRESVRALATILGAQLATLFGSAQVPEAVIA